MKKNSLFMNGFMCLAACALMVVFGVGSSWGETVESGKAKFAVQNWIKRGLQPMGSRFKDPTTGESRTFSNTDGVPLFYVVEMKEGGFVVTSADTKVNPIIAFCDSGEFVADASNPLYVLLERDMSNRIASSSRASLKSLSSAATLTVAEVRWNELTATARKVLSDAETPPEPEVSLQGITDVRVSPMIQSKWGQSGRWNGNYIWNYHTPNNYVCGCTATAVSQVMRYWKAPTEYVQPYTRTCQVDDVETDKTMKGGTYDWENMPLSSAEITDVTQCEAIGRLAYDVGVASAMNWCKREKGGSAASLANAAAGLRSCFGYASVDYINENAASGNLKTMPYANDILGSLNAGMPVVLGIYFAVNGEYKNGHAVVIDGYGYYNNVMYSHINVGWEGKGDVWYNLFDDIVTVQSSSWDTIWGVLVNIHPTGKGRVLSGRVQNQTGAGVEGASVKVVTPSQTSITAVSRANGIWSVRTQDANGDYYVTATKSGLNSTTKKVTSSTNNGNLWNVDLSLLDSNSQPDLCFVKPNSWPQSVFLSNAEGMTIAKTTFTEGEPIYLYNQFGNNGAAAITKDYKILHEVLNSTGTVISSVPCDCTSSLWLPAGDVRQWGGYTFAIPQNLAAGKYTYRCILDSDKVIAESDESNNIVTISFTVVVSSAKPDLCFVCPDGWPKSVFLSDSAEVTTEKTSFAESDTIYLYNRFGNDGAAAIARDYTILHEVLNASGSVVASSAYNCTSGLWLAPGVSKQWGGVVYPVFSNLSAGKYTYRCTLDSGNVLSESNESNNSVTIDFTVTASASYTLKVNPNGGILVGTNFGSAEGTGQQASVIVKYGAIYYWLLGTATLNGFVFDGWWTSSTGGEQVYDSDGKAVIGSSYWDDSWQWRYNGDVVVYAHWIPNTYTVDYNLNGGTKGTYAPSTAMFGSPFRVSAPTRGGGYTFAGWTVTSGLNTSIAKYGTSSTDQAISITGSSMKCQNGGSGDVYFLNLTDASNGSVMLEANWTSVSPTTCKVSFNSNGGTGTMADQTFVQGVTQSLRKNTFTKEKHKFVGWATSADGNIVYTDEQSITVSADMPLYAVWTLIDGNTPPSWTPVTKEDSMVVYATVFDASRNEAIEADGSMLGVFSAKGECRGSATIMSGPSGKLFVLTVSAENATESGFVLKVWNAATGEISDIPERISCNADMQIGVINSPYAFRIGANAIEVTLKEGWNWFSSCLVADDSSVGAVFGDCSFSDGDVVKSATDTTTYYGGKWYPSDYSIVPGFAYCVKKSSGGTETVTLTGAAVTGGVSVKSGWNWIGTTVVNTVPISTVLHSGGFADNDIVKSATDTTTYYNGQWWSASVFNLEPGMGYKAKIANAGALTFTSSALSNVRPTEKSAEKPSFAAGVGNAAPSEWEPVPQEQNITAYLQVRHLDGNGNFEAVGTTLAAFSSSGECRGVSEIMTGPTEKLFQLTIGLVSETESGLTLKLWDSDSGCIYEIEEELSGGMVSDGSQTIGKIVSPLSLTVKDPSAVTYTIAYRKGAYGTGTEATDTKTHDKNLNLKDSIFTRTGYTQTGWSTSDGGSRTYNLSASYTANATLTLYPFWTANTYTIRFNANGGTGAMSDLVMTYDVEKNLTKNCFSKSKNNFVGWATNEIGNVVYADGVSVKNLSADQNTKVMLYAVWEETGESKNYTLHDTPVYGGLSSSYKGGTFNGYAVDGDGLITGTFVLVVKKPAKGKTSSAATLTFVSLATGKKTKITGTVNLATGAGNGGLAGLTFGANAVGGTVAKVGTLAGGVDAAKTKNAAALAVLSKFSGKSYVVALESENPDTFAQGGCSTLAITIAAKGKAKVSGVLADGTKVTASGVMTVGDDYCCVPVIYSKKSKFGFVAWFDKNTKQLLDVTALTPWKNTVKPSFTMAWDVVALGAKGNVAAGTRMVELDDIKLTRLVPGAVAQTPFDIPLKVSGTKWDAGKAAKVAYKGGAVTVTGTNVSGLKLTYTAKTGLFKGSFTVYAVKGGKLTKNKFSVFGAVTGGVGYGTAVLKGKGSVAVMVE